jgi:hypothetical protein
MNVNEYIARHKEGKEKQQYLRYLQKERKEYDRIRNIEPWGMSKYDALEFLLSHNVTEQRLILSISKGSHGALLFCLLLYIQYISVTYVLL